jgi:hypothetical protein
VYPPKYGEEWGQVLARSDQGFKMADSDDKPNGTDGDRDDDLVPDAELAGLDRPLHEVLGIELRFAPEHLAPPVDEERLKAFIRNELSADDRDETIDMIASFRSWYQALGDVLRQTIGRRHSD